jgi:hypothetical protein
LCVCLSGHNLEKCDSVQGIYIYYIAGAKAQRKELAGGLAPKQERAIWGRDYIQSGGEPTGSPTDHLPNLTGRYGRKFNNLARRRQ